MLTYLFQSKIALPIFCLSLVALSFQAQAQQTYAPAAVLQQKDSSLHHTPIDSDKEETATSDIGVVEIVERSPKPDIFAVSTTQEYIYTSNVFLSDSHPQASSAYHGNYQVAVNPYSTFDWHPQVSAQYNMYRYSDQSRADFDNEILSFSSPYFFTRDHEWLYTPSIDLNRFTTPRATPGSYYKEVTYDNQVSHSVRIIPTEEIYFIGAYDIIYRQTDPGLYSRVDNVLTLGLTYPITPEITLQPYVRPAAYYYPNNTSAYSDRSDFNLSCGMTVSYQPLRYMSLQASFYNVENFSSAANNTYNEIVPGVSVTGKVSF